MAMVQRTTGYGVSITKDPTSPGWVRVSLRKHWWTVERKSQSRLVAETGFYVGDRTAERDVLEDALREILRAYCDDIS